MDTMWRFVHLTDTHLGSMVDGEWNNRFLCTMMPDVMRCLRRDLAKINPDFILVTGDIASHHSRDAVFAARDLLDSLGFPYYPMGGNHDFLSERMREWFLDAFHARLPGGDTVYSFTHKNLHFCVLDPWWKWRDDSLCPVAEASLHDAGGISMHGARWAMPPHELAWLENDLAEHAAGPVVIATHYPAIGIPRRLRRAGLCDAGHLDNGEILLDICRRHPHVKAIFSGHVHMHIIESCDGLTHVVTGSMPEFPCEYRDVHVYDNRIEIHTCALSNTSFANRSLIPGHDYTAGMPQDRRATISLS
ncbi:MAG TPA: metallophosphoesterase [Candidatus Hydrogenedentes bacterium]|nr:metallophosphoesterase [Candidatus Hydrogenedentota bacterium]